MNQAAVTADIRRDLVTLLPRLRRFALTLTGGAQEADELVAEACSRAIHKSHQWKGEGRIETWLFGLMRSTLSEDARKRRRSNEADAASGAARQAKAADAAADDILASLPEGLASALLLADVEHFSHAEAAAILGVTQDNFAAKLCAARLRLAATGGEMTERRA